MTINASNNPEVTSVTTYSEKSGAATLLLCIFLGNFGIHRFYVGKIGTGILMLLTFGLFGIWTIVDIVLIATGHFEDSKGLPVGFKRSRKSKGNIIFRTLGVIIALLIIFIGLSVGTAFYTTRELVNTVQSQLSALSAGDYEKAYSYNSTTFQQKVSLEEFKKLVEKQPEFKNNKDTTFIEREVIRNHGRLVGSLQSTDGTVTPVEYRLVKENGVWKILYVTTNTDEIEENLENRVERNR